MIDSNVTLIILECIMIISGVNYFRGFFPKGRGEVLITLDPVHHLKPITLLDRGDISGITIEAFTAGLVHRKVSKRSLLIVWI